ncbi:MAG: hypothetical protein N2167_11200 [Flavobacteriales bacterium]|nr:hypothetical protein [Flavobacteriales bacterium]
MKKIAFIKRLFFAFSVFFSLTLSILPDAILNYFHKHRHITCEAHDPGEFNLESEHIHCEFPDLYLYFIEDSPPILSYFPLVLGNICNTNIFVPHIVTIRHFAGRAPPILFL